MSRELDAKVAEKVFGLSVQEFQLEDGDIRYRLIDGMAPARYTEDARADYEVLRHIRETWTVDQITAYIFALHDLWGREGDICFEMSYRPGDWSRAALKALGE